ncbi:MAG: HAMP domain-containing sensor histidine kinase [Bacillota bacterium]|nr:HAMP domain-containing sensor histidine kinase [Bacillota bacterium]
MSGLKRKLLIKTGTFVILTIFLAEMILVFSARHYYYDQISQLMLDRATVAANFYNRYLPDRQLQYRTANIMEDARHQQSLAVQVLDENGYLIEDADGFYYEDLIQTPDVIKAKQGLTQVCTYKSESGENVAAVSAPLLYQGKTAGFLRYVSSLEQVETEIKEIALLGMGAGFLVLLFSGLFSLVLARSIIDPVEELTVAARHIAKGDYSKKAVRRENDEIGHLADTFNYMVDEIARSEELKNEFISSISHELRTPLTSIKGWSETLLSGDLNNKEETIQGLEIISDETDRLSSLVEDLLDFSRYQSGGFTLSKSPFNTNDLVQEVLRQFHPGAAEKGINLQFHANNTLPMLYADRNRVKQVLINLMVNALKFTPESGQIEIITDTKDNWVIVTVRDNGSGVSPEDLPRLTEKFFKGDSAKSGSGLGLSICKEIVTLHEGELTISSKLGEGTTVTLTL